MKSSDRQFSIILFANLPRTTEITWSLFSLLIVGEYKTIVHWKTSFGSFKVSSLVLVSCFHDPNSSFVVQIAQFVKFFNIHYLFHVINFYWFMFKDFSYSNSSKLLIWLTGFSVAVSVRPYNCRLPSSIFP